jgi:hydrogenase maturation protease
MRDGRAEIERPGPESVTVAGVTVAAGSRVVLHPHTTTDVLMRALDGRRAIVEAVMEDLEDGIRLTVALEGDPARSLGKARGLGHRFFFAPDELEPLPTTGAPSAPRRVLVAGIGNVFMGDDGFGVEAVGALAGRELPEGVEVVDFGIRGMDLAYALIDGYHSAILVDATPRGQAPGTIEVIEPELRDDVFMGFEAHGMDPLSVLQFARQFGALPARVLIVGCEPLDVGDPEAADVAPGLSAPVAGAVPAAVALIERLIEELCGPSAQDNQGGPR